MEEVGFPYLLKEHSEASFAGMEEPMAAPLHNLQSQVVSWSS